MVGFHAFLVFLSISNLHSERTYAHCGSGQKENDLASLGRNKLRVIEYGKKQRLKQLFETAFWNSRESKKTSKNSSSKLQLNNFSCNNPTLIHGILNIQYSLALSTSMSTKERWPTFWCIHPPTTNPTT